MTTDSKKDFPELQKELTRLVEQSRIPVVGVTDVDPTSEGRWKALTIRSLGRISGPFRALKLSKGYYSEGRLCNNSDPRRMTEEYLRIESDEIEFLKEPEIFKDEIKTLEDNLKTQHDQVDSNFRIVNIDMRCSKSELSGDRWTVEYERLMRESKASLLYITSPPDMETAEEILELQIRGIEENSNQANPLFLSGYVPRISPEESIRLIDAYVNAGMTAIVYDFRRRPLNDSSLTHLAAIVADREKPPFVHCLHVNPKKKAGTYDSILDLLMSTFGIQTISNLRRPPGGGGDSTLSSELRKGMKCIHNYQMPTLEQLTNGGFVCPQCDTERIEKAINEGKRGKIDAARIVHNAVVSHEELENVRTSIKHGFLKDHLKDKSGVKSLKDVLTRFENSLKRERERMKSQEQKHGG